MKLLYRLDKDWKTYRKELVRLQNEHNYTNFLILSGLAFFSCGIFFFQNLFVPDSEKIVWLNTAYTFFYLGGMCISVLFFATQIVLNKFGKTAIRDVSVIVFSFAIVSLGSTITILDLFTSRNIIAVFAASLGVCILLNAECWVYFALEGWILVLFGICSLTVLKGIVAPGAIATMGFLVVSSLVMGLHMRITRLHADLLSLQMEDKNRELREVMIHDPLTGAYNRLFLDEYLAKQMVSMKRYGDCLSILMLDIDYFKKVNDTLGHPAGDAVLKKLVSAILEHIRDSDILARIGGEEFILALPRTTWENAFLIAGKLCALVRDTPFDVPWPVTVSIGVTSFSCDEPLEAAIARVDAALYLAKKMGRNRVEGFKPETTDFDHSD